MQVMNFETLLTMMNNQLLPHAMAFFEAYEMRSNRSALFGEALFQYSNFCTNGLLLLYFNIQAFSVFVVPIQHSS